jgi:hypothetical protein
VIFGSSITSTVMVVFVLNLVFNRWVKLAAEARAAADRAGLRGRRPAGPAIMSG